MLNKARLVFVLSQKSETLFYSRESKSFFTTTKGGMVSSLSHVQKTFTHKANLDIDQHVIYFQTYIPPRYLAMAPLAANLINNKLYLYEQNKKLVESSTIHQNKRTKTTQTDTLSGPPKRQIYDLSASATLKKLAELVNSIRNEYKGSEKDYAIFLLAPKVVKLEFDPESRINFEFLSAFRFHFSFEHSNDYVDCFRTQSSLLDCFSLNLYQIA